jgi:alpha-tubulin suppressor-like RCC1 family protein
MGDRAVALRIGVVVAGLALAASTLGPAVGSAAPAEPTDSMATGTTKTGTTTTATARTTAPRGRTLKIKITPPPSRKARVEVRGPQGFRKVLGKSTTLKRLTPGRYRITATQVSTRAWVAKPTFSKRAVRVTSRKGAEVTVGYLAVSTKVEVVKPATVKAFEPPVDGSGTLTTTADLEPGEIAAAGVGAETPQGMLVRVQDVRSSGSTSTYVVRQARLDEAIVQGEFEATITADLGVEARRARTHGRGSAAPKPLCTYGTDGADIDPTGGIDMKLTGSWGNGSPSLTVSVTPYAQVQAKAYLGARLSCAKELTFLDRQTAPITVMIGPVPLVFVPRLKIVGGVKLDAVAAMKLDASARVDGNVTATASGSALSTRVTPPTFTRRASLEMQGNASLDIYARARLTAELYGVGGPYAQVQIGVKGSADVATNPWWSVDAYGKAGVGVAIEKCADVLLAKWCISLQAGKDDIIDKSMRIVDSGGPFGGTTPTATPTPTPTATPTSDPVSGEWREVVAGGLSTCGIKADTSGWCWGTNVQGVLGIGKDSNASPTDWYVRPQPLAGGGSWRAIDVGDFHACGIRTDGSLWCWGGNYAGEIGDGTTSPTRSSPTRVGSGTDWIQVDVQDSLSCALRADGTTWCWGTFGDGPAGEVRAQTTPLRVSDSGVDQDITNNGMQVCMRRAGDSVWCKQVGQYGNLTEPPQQFPGSWLTFSYTGEHYCGVQPGSLAWCGGNNQNGELGWGTVGMSGSEQPVAGEPPTLFYDVQTGQGYTCGISYSAALWCWGGNNGRLGDGTTTNRSTPTQVGTWEDWKSVSVNGGHTCGVRDDGSAWCWGANSYGQLGDGTMTTRLVPTRVT